jgi:aryl-alcohol dehydrogenase-like predicted oxidoreductase
MRTRRLGRLGHQSSVIVYGAAGLSTVDQDTADTSIQVALDAGVNHFDVAASYGEAELRLGPWMGEIRDRIFLASKTGDRDAAGARASIEASLVRLQTDSLDLIQLHGVNSLAELDAVTAPGGAVEAAVRARDEGLVAAIGITGHGNDAPAVHLEGLRRFPFDTVLSPWNHVLSTDPVYAAAFAALAAETTRVDAALLTIKTGSRRNWPTDAHAYATWYEPLDDQRAISAAVAWVLSHDEITAIPSAGDPRLLPLFLQAEAELDQWDRVSAAAVLAEQPDMSSPFVSIPF